MTTALALLPDFALILLGFGLRRAMHLGDHFWAGLEKLVYFVLFPALLFNALVRTAIDWQAAAPLAATGALAMGVAMVLGGAARWLFPQSPISFASQFQCAFRFNSYIGLAVAGNLHGAAGIAAMGLLTGAMVPLANVAAVWMLARHGSAGVWRELAKNPLILATLAGLLWNLAGWPVPTPALKFLGRLSEASITLGLLAVGSALKLRGAFGGGGYGAALWLSAVKLLAMPAATLLLARGFGLTGVYFDVALAFAALPTATSAYILTQRMGGDGPRVAWIISATTLAAMVTLPAWLGSL
ncbi:MAG: AEC family transporter [Sterolibacteriaceae bacterium MAG5]|nr:AEC family transporter [Candidatus Nitricoxidireducens bremensis]